jgi:hypothetical protein
MEVSEKAKIAAVGVTGVGIGALCYYFAVRALRQSKIDDFGVKNSHKRSSRESNAERKQEYPDSIRQELTSRVQAFFGTDGFAKLEKSYVIVSLTGRFEAQCYLRADCRTWWSWEPLRQHVSSIRSGTSSSY